MTQTLPPATSSALEDDAGASEQFHKPRTAGLGQLGIGASMMVIVACIAGVILLFAAGFLPTLIYATLALLLVGGASYRNHHDESLLARIGTRMAWKRADRRGETVMATGPLSNFGTFTLPGVLAKTNLTEWKDNLGRVFQMLHFKVHNRFSVTIECEPDGSSLHDRADIDNARNNWRLWIDTVSHEPHLSQLQITVQTQPDSGQTLRREIDTHQVTGAPDLSVQAMAEVKNTYPNASSLVESFVTLTYKGGKRKPEEMAAHLQSRLPSLTTFLETAGAGPSEPVTAQRLTHVVKTAYNPDHAKVLSDAELVGISAEDLVLRWESAGPHAYFDGYEVLHTDGAWHISWVKTGLHSDLTAETMNPLLESHKDIFMKRVTFLFWPHNPAVAANRAKKDRTNAKKRVTNSKDPSQDAENAFVATRNIAREHGKGSALVDWAMVFTATVLKEEDIPAAVAAMDTLAPSARIQHNKTRGTMGFAHAQGLPLGIVATDYDYLPQSIRQGM